MESGDDGEFLEGGGSEKWEVGRVELDVSARICAWSVSLHTMKEIKEGSTQDIHVSIYYCIAGSNISTIMNGIMIFLFSWLSYRDRTLF